MSRLVDGAFRWRGSSGWWVAALAAAAACQPSAPEPVQPSPGSFLSRKADAFSDRDGLVNEASEQEAVEHYVAIRALPPNPLGWELKTLDDWKRRFEFPLQEPGESLDAYRLRTQQVVYYNRLELALGRELGCSTFTDENGAEGVACFVSNYGAGFGDGDESLSAAIDGHPVRNTVCISYSPALEAYAEAQGWGSGYGVQFYVYGDDGTIRYTAQLDRMGQRPVPQICTNCHGGTYRPDKHLSQYARFLPANPFFLTFGKAPYDLDSQQEALRFVNNLALRTPPSLTDAQRTFLRTIYELDPGQEEIPPGRIPTLKRSFPGWANEVQQDLYKRVLLPYCATCHNAFGPGANQVENWGALWGRDGARWETFVRRDLCSLHTMPNAQPTMNTFWTDPIRIGSKTWPSAKDFLVQVMEKDGLEYGPGGTARTCTVAMGQGCNVPGDLAASHARCGDPAQSGRYCDVLAQGGVGVCRPGCGPAFGNVQCPNYGLSVKECRSGVCVSCGRIGQTPCAGNRCNEGCPGPAGACATCGGHSPPT